MQWASTPAVQSWMKTQNINSTDGVYEYFVEKVDAMTIALGKSPVRWEEVWKHFGTDLDKRTVIHAWLSSGALIDATSKGYRAIWSVDGLYYLDALDEVWQSFYSAWLRLSCAGMEGAVHTRAAHCPPPPHTHNCGYTSRTLPHTDVDILAGITNTSAIPLVLGGETEMCAWVLQGRCCGAPTPHVNLQPTASMAAHHQTLPPPSPQYSCWQGARLRMAATCCRPFGRGQQLPQSASGPMTSLARPMGA